MDVEAEVPTAVYALDLQRVSHLLGIPEAELLSGFQADPTRSEIQGVIVDAGENVPFETVGHDAVTAPSPDQCAAPVASRTPYSRPLARPIGRNAQFQTPCCTASAAHRSRETWGAG